MKVVKNYLKCNNVKILTKEETYELITKAQAGCRQSKDKLVIHNLALVIQLANRHAYAISGVLDFDDLFAEGVIGLMKAIEKFDIKRDLALSTYASFWINQRMDRFADNNRGPVRTPIYLQNLKRKYNKLKKEDNSHNDDFYMRLVANQSEYAVSTLRYAISNAPSELHIDDAGTNQDGGGVGEGYQLESIVDENEINVNMLDFQTMVNKIGGRDKAVIEMRLEGFTLKQIAQTMHISRERVRQLEDSVILKLKAMINSVKGIKTFEVKEELRDNFMAKLTQARRKKQIKSPVRIDSSLRYSPILGVCTECMFAALREPENASKYQQGQPNWVTVSCDVCGKVKPCANPKDFMWPVFVISEGKQLT